MNRFLFAVVAVLVATGCSRGASEPASEGAPLETVLSAADKFIGTWRATTPLMEFVRLTVSPLEVEQGKLGARLTYSGVLWEGTGRVEAGTLTTNMSIPGVTSSGVMVARFADQQTLKVQMRPSQGATNDITFVRDR